MSDFLSNVWVISITTSIIGGGIITFFTTLGVKIRNKRKYKENVQKANKDLMYTLRPFIVEKTTPNYDIIKSLINSKAIEYNVKIESLNNINQIIDNLVKEIVENYFLTVEQKLEYCNLVKEMSVSNITNHIETDNKSNLFFPILFFISINFIVLIPFLFQIESTNLNVAEPLNLFTKITLIITGISAGYVLTQLILTLKNNYNDYQKRNRELLKNTKEHLNTINESLNNLKSKSKPPQQ